MSGGDIVVSSEVSDLLADISRDTRLRGLCKKISFRLENAGPSRSMNATRFDLGRDDIQGIITTRMGYTRQAQQRARTPQYFPSEPVPTATLGRTEKRRWGTAKILEDTASATREASVTSEAAHCPAKTSRVLAAIRKAPPNFAQQLRLAL
ncbi:hypothetical protein KCU88_g75, partial [Aureobasidium melanogenum]